MDWTAVLVAAIPAACGVISAYMAHGAKKKTESGNSEILVKMNSINSRIGLLEVKREDEASQLSKIARDLNDNNLRTLRLDLLHAIETDPDNQLVILELAQKYFVDMKGNCYMSGVFQQWADEHNVNITSIFNKG